MASAEPNISKYLHSKGCRLGIPVGGTFELTPRCNFSCRMCYVHLQEAEIRERRKRELSADEWLKIAADAKKAGMVFLLLTGGEPLMRPDFRYIYTELKKMGLLVSINTNASLLDSEYIGFFKNDPPHRFNVTLYGASEDTYDSLCRNRSFEKVYGNLKALREAGLSVRLNVSYTPYNVGDMEKIQKIADELALHCKPTTYMYPPIRVDSGKTGTNDSRFSPADAAKYEVKSDILRFSDEDYMTRCANVVNGIRHMSEEECEGIAGERIMCRAGRSTFWLTWDGRMTACGMMNEPSANVLDDGFESSWRHVHESAESIRLPHECAVCDVRHACHVCAAVCCSETGSFDKKPGYVCEMVGEYVKLSKLEHEKRSGT